MRKCGCGGNRSAVTHALHGGAVDAPHAGQRSQPWLGLWPWAPGGYISRADERVDTYTQDHSPQAARLDYEWLAAAQHLDRGDEVFGGSSYAYVEADTDTLRAAAEIRAQAFGQLVSEESPTTTHWPDVNSITQSLYDGVNALWARIARANGGTGEEW